MRSDHFSKARGRKEASRVSTTPWSCVLDDQDLRPARLRTARTLGRTPDDVDLDRARPSSHSRSKSIRRSRSRDAFLPRLRLKLQLYLLLVPSHDPRSRNQQGYAHHAHQDLNSYRVGDLDQDDMSGK